MALKAVVKDAHVESLSHGDLLIIGLKSFVAVHHCRVDGAVQRPVQANHFVILVN